ncbi:MAG: hypothetical protein AAGF12_06425 [Myxococcota bacterium]
MKIETVHEQIAAPASKVFEFVSSVHNLPRWAVPFCQRLDERADGFYAVSASRALAFEMKSDATTGAVDLRFGRERSAMATYPLRVVPLGPASTLVTFTGWQLPGMSEEGFTSAVGGLRAELQQLRRLMEA